MLVGDRSATQLNVFYKHSYQFKDVTVPPAANWGWGPRNYNDSYSHFIESLYCIIFNFFYFTTFFSKKKFNFSGNFIEIFTFGATDVFIYLPIVFYLLLFHLI